MKQTKVKELMSVNPQFIDATSSLQQAAQTMKDVDCGVLPVGHGGRVEGIITDRDITIRAIAEGRDPKQATVGQYMSDRVYTCNGENTLKEAADIMAKHQVSRLVVDNEEGIVTGILSFGRMLSEDDNAKEVSKVVRHATAKTAA